MPTIGKAANFWYALRPTHRRNVLRDAVRRLKHKRFDAIAVRGVSGAVIGGLLAHALGKHLMIIRKPGDGDSRLDVSADAPIKRYIVVDDLIDTGSTVRQVKKTVRQEWRRGTTWMSNPTPPPKFVGVYLYMYDEFRRDV